jgi:hypothetical protein
MSHMIPNVIEPPANDGICLHEYTYVFIVLDVVWDLTRRMYKRKKLIPEAEKDKVRQERFKETYTIIDRSIRITNLKSNNRNQHLHHYPYHPMMMKNLKMMMK